MEHMTDGSPAPDGDDIDVDQVAVLLTSGAALLDVREPYEWDAGHAPQARHLPMGLLSLDGLPEGRPLLVVCHLGVRSAAAVQALQRAGVEAKNVSGGMAAWSAAGLPVVTATGAPGAIV
jgi:rhodanese-related sulfurtransferase